jgi:hypothetical protein
MDIDQGDKKKMYGLVKWKFVYGYSRLDHKRNGDIRKYKYLVYMNEYKNAAKMLRMSDSRTSKQFYKVNDLTVLTSRIWNKERDKSNCV